MDHPPNAKCTDQWPPSRLGRTRQRLLRPPTSPLHVPCGCFKQPTAQRSAATTALLACHAVTKRGLVVTVLKHLALHLAASWLPPKAEHLKFWVHKLPPPLLTARAVVAKRGLDGDGGPLVSITVLPRQLTQLLVVFVGPRLPAYHQSNQRMSTARWVQMAAAGGAHSAAGIVGRARSRSPVAGGSSVLLWTYFIRTV